MTAITKKLFLKGSLGTRSVSTQFQIFLILLCFLRFQVWSRWDRSFYKGFCRILESCCCVLKICYLFGSQLIWQCHDICIPSSKMGEENFSKNLLWQVRKFWFQRGECRLIFERGYRQFLEKIEHSIFAV